MDGIQARSARRRRDRTERSSSTTAQIRNKTQHTDHSLNNRRRHFPAGPWGCRDAGECWLSDLGSRGLGGAAMAGPILNERPVDHLRPAVAHGRLHASQGGCNCARGRGVSRRPRALRRLKKISGASRRGSLTFCNNFAVCSFSAKT
jgi:hypothetical protein